MKTDAIRYTDKIKSKFFKGAILHLDSNIGSDVGYQILSNAGDPVVVKELILGKIGDDKNVKWLYAVVVLDIVSTTIEYEFPARYFCELEELQNQ